MNGRRKEKDLYGNREAVTVELLEPYENAETGELNQGTITMEPFECRILIRTHSDTEKG